MDHDIQYCMTPDGVRLAYAFTGTGTPVVRASHWFAHLNHDLESPVYRHTVIDIARCHRLLRYDARGIGLSQRDNVGTISFETFVSDLGVVIDAAGLEKFVLYGSSQGSAQAIAYAARHPERVSHLILFGAYARGALRRGSVEAETQKVELACALIRTGWGSQDESHRQFFTSQFIPDADKTLQHALNETQRVAATPEMAERFLRVSADLDVSADLSRIRCPTLVLHSMRDLRVPFEMGQEVAAGIAGAKFVPLDTGNHLLMANEPARRVRADAIADFLGDKRARHLAHTETVTKRLEQKAHALERNWLIKFILVFAACTGCLIFFWEVWKILRGATH
jgi:pimeloyl-ACP methyl ester carboxylesterase